MSHLFAYGTLKRGGYWHHLLGLPGGRFVAEARLAGYACGPAFPGSSIPMATGAPGRTLAGELYAVDEATLARVDRLEAGYARRLVHPSFHDDDGDGQTRTAAAWVYVRPGRFPRLPGRLWGAFDPASGEFHD